MSSMRTHNRSPSSDKASEKAAKRPRNNDALVEDHVATTDMPSKKSNTGPTLLVPTDNSTSRAVDVVSKTVLTTSGTTAGGTHETADDSESTASDGPTPASSPATTAISTTDVPKTSVVLPLWVDDEVAARITTFLTYNDSSTNRFALGAVPPDAAWGPDNNKDLAKYLCVAGRPASFWILGVVETTWFRNQFGQPQKQVNIGVSALRANRRPGNRIYARRFMSRFDPDTDEAIVDESRRIYDATEGFGRKSGMKTLKSGQIRIGDIVLIEAALQRYKTGSNRMWWDQWGTNFELQAVSVLARNPSPAPVPTEYVAEPEDSDIMM